MTDTDIHDERHPPAPTLAQIDLKTDPALLRRMIVCSIFDWPPDGLEHAKAIRMLDALIAERDAMQRRAESAEQDWQEAERKLAEERERVNWLDRDDVTLVPTTRMDKPIVLIFSAKNGHLIGEGETLRAAIDAARQSAQAVVGDGGHTA